MTIPKEALQPLRSRRDYGEEDEKIARELVAVARELSAARLGIRQVSRPGHTRMWVVSDNDGLVYGFMTKMPDTLTDKFPFQVYQYSSPMMPPVRSSERPTRLGDIWTDRGAKALKIALKNIKKGRRFGEITV